MTMEQVKAAILGSPEYFQKQGNDNTAWVQAVYQAVLNRPIDPAGQSAWTNALTYLDRATVADLILTSRESQQDVIQFAYEQYLHRPADSGGLLAWLANIQHGMTDQTLTADIVGSDEFFGGM